MLLVPFRLTRCQQTLFLGSAVKFVKITFYNMLKLFVRFSTKPVPITRWIEKGRCRKTEPKSFLGMYHWWTNLYIIIYKTFYNVRVENKRLTILQIIICEAGISVSLDVLNCILISNVIVPTWHFSWLVVRLTFWVSAISSLSPFGPKHVMLNLALYG